MSNQRSRSPNRLWRTHRATSRQTKYSRGRRGGTGCAHPDGRFGAAEGARVGRDERQVPRSVATKAELPQTGDVSEKKKHKVRISRSTSSSRMLTSEQRRKTTANGKPRDASTPSGATAAESVRALLRNLRYSKRRAPQPLRAARGARVSAQRVEGGTRRGSVDDGSGQI